MNTAYSIDSEKSAVLKAYEPDFSIYSPSTYTTFGEYSEPAPNVQGVDDTGRIMRAILPISSATTRENLSNYTGKGTLLNSHVVYVFCSWRSIRSPLLPLASTARVSAKTDACPLARTTCSLPAKVNKYRKYLC